MPESASFNLHVEVKFSKSLHKHNLVSCCKTSCDKFYNLHCFVMYQMGGHTRARVQNGSGLMDYQEGYLSLRQAQT